MDGTRFGRQRQLDGAWILAGVVPPIRSLAGDLDLLSVLGGAAFGMGLTLLLSQIRPAWFIPEGRSADAQALDLTPDLVVKELKEIETMLATGKDASGDATQRPGAACRVLDSASSSEGTAPTERVPREAVEMRKRTGAGQDQRAA